jgi:type II secretory pathway predicted ATPase ExeA
MLQLVILGQMELLPKVKKVRNFLDRIAVKYIINPLDEIETGKMIDYRLRQAGYDQERKLFTSEAVQKVYQATGGTPRQIARICHQALELLIAEDRESVSAELIDRILNQEAQWKA